MKNNNKKVKPYNDRNIHMLKNFLCTQDDIKNMYTN